MSRDGTYKPQGASIVTIPVSPELHRRLRIHCASEGRSVKWVGTKAIEAWLDQHEARAALDSTGEGRAALATGETSPEKGAGALNEQPRTSEGE